jgi:uncharacterized protein YjbI with pentapeptide repeats
LQRLDLSTMDLSGAILSDAKLSGANLSGADLSEADLNHAKLSGVDLSGANLSGAILRRATLSHALLYQADLHGADLSHAKLSGNLERVSLNGAYLYGADLSGADLDGADLRDSALSGADLSDATLWSSILVDANLSGANLSDADLKPADLRDAKLSRIFEDHFSDTSSGWVHGKGTETEPFVIEYHTGKFRVYNPPPGNALFATNPNTSSAIEDTSVEADATLTRNIPQNRDYGWGIICRADDNFKNMYRLGIYADGSATIWKVEDNNLKELDTGSPRDAVPGTAKNHLRADCSGSTLALYVNDRKVLEAPANAEFESSGSPGFYVEDSHNGEAVNILFDNFVVTGPKPKGLP